MNTVNEKPKTEDTRSAKRVFSVLVAVFSFVLLVVLFFTAFFYSEPRSNPVLRGIVDFLVWHPGHFWAISIVFGVLALAALVVRICYPQIRSLPMSIASVVMFVASFVWLVFGFLERECVIHKSNIRVDILFIWPILFAGTAILIGIFVISLIRAVCNRDK
jgi:hypothetical protein